jgi:hypothetical protein
MKEMIRVTTMNILPIHNFFVVDMNAGSEVTNSSSAKCCIETQTNWRIRLVCTLTALSM